MSIWIGENSRLVPVRLVSRLACAELQQPGLGFTQVLIDLEADVQLLRNDLVNCWMASAAAAAATSKTSTTGGRWAQRDWRARP
jgi:hypothetical protein